MDPNGIVVAPKSQTSSDASAYFDSVYGRAYSIEIAIETAMDALREFIDALIPGPFFSGAN
jgi:hypothetical protein